MVRRHVVVEVEGDVEVVLERMRGRLAGGLDVLSELMAPVRLVGSGPPEFVGRIDGRAFRLRASWPPMSHRWFGSLLAIEGVAEPMPGGTRLRAVIRLRPLQYALFMPVVALAAAAVALAEFGWFLLWPAAIGLVWLSYLWDDMALASIGLQAFAAPGKDRTRSPSVSLF